MDGRRFYGVLNPTETYQLLPLAFGNFFVCRELNKPFSGTVKALVYIW